MSNDLDAYMECNLIVLYIILDSEDNNNIGVEHLIYTSSYEPAGSPDIAYFRFTNKL